MDPYNVIVTLLRVKTIPVDDETGLPPIEFVHGRVLMETVQGQTTLYIACLLVDCSRKEGQWVAVEVKSLLRNIELRLSAKAKLGLYSLILGWRLKLVGWLLASFGWNKLSDYVVTKTFFGSLRKLTRNGQIKLRKFEDGEVYIQPTPKLVKITPLDNKKYPRERLQPGLTSLLLCLIVIDLLIVLTKRTNLPKQQKDDKVWSTTI